MSNAEAAPNTDAAPPVDQRALEAVLIGDNDPEIVALEAEIRAAQLGANVAALDRLISVKLLFTGPDGQLATKA